jgi:hypothetical protein
VGRAKKVILSAEMSLEETDEPIKGSPAQSSLTDTSTYSCSNLTKEEKEISLSTSLLIFGILTPQAEENQQPLVFLWIISVLRALAHVKKNHTRFFSTKSLS